MWLEDIPLIVIPVIAMSTSMALFVVAISSKTSRGDQLLSPAMVVIIGFGVAGSGGMCLHKMSLFRLCFASVNVPEGVHDD